MAAQKFLPENQSNSKRSLVVARFFERIFRRIGSSVAHRPYTYIFVTLILAIFCSFGFIHFKFEAVPHNLWLPTDSDFLKTLKWGSENFKRSFRRQIALLEGDNVLHPTYIKELHRILKTVSEIEVTDDEGISYRLKDVCIKIPQIRKLKDSWIIKRLSYFGSDDDSTPSDWSLYLDSETYCKLYESLPKTCLTLSLLEMWDLDENMLDSLTQQDIINAVNTVNESSTFGFPFDFARMIGGITKNESGHIIAAKSTMAVWLTNVNKDAKSYKKIISAGLADQVDQGLYRWEGEFINAILNETGRPEEIAVFPQAIRSIEHISENAMQGDVILLLVGTITLYIYVIIMLGKFNMVEARSMLSLLGFISIYGSIISAFGLCSAMGIIYCPLHSFLPLILLGLGVDDMFVLMRTWENLMNDQSFTKRSLQFRLAETLKKSGVAIFITSLTDCVAFSIGSLTSLPALHSFCLYSAVGVAFLFISQVTVFFACFVLDQKRLEEHRNGIIYCIKHKNWTGNSCSKINFMQRGFEKFSAFLLKPKIKVFIIILTAVITSVCLWGVTNLKQEFNPIWLLPHSSYLYKFVIRAFKYYPEVGSFGEVFLDKLAVTKDIHKVGLISSQLENHPSISQLESFYTSLVNYTFDDTDLDISHLNINDTLSSAILGRFMFSLAGASYGRFFSFDGTLKCGQDTPPVNAVKLRFVHKQFPDRNSRIEAMDDIKNIVRKANFSGFAEATSHAYSGWESDKIIVYELVQNLSLSLIAVFIMTTLLLANIKASFLVFTCVLITLIEVMALMNWWGLTIDVVTCINLVLCIGLSVDYCAHIALHFMKATGTKSERAQASLVEIGPAVLNGACSTYLAFALLGSSDSHVFISFYKVFLGVFIFGLYQGLILLPVLLSILGPDSYNLEGNHSNAVEDQIEVKKISLYRENIVE